MVDLGQADAKRRVNPKSFNWTDVVQEDTACRGDICVIRQLFGSPEIFVVRPRENWKEWVGAFSRL